MARGDHTNRWAHWNAREPRTKRLIKDYPDSALIDSARNHLDQLDRGSIKDFYDWFAKQEPGRRPWIKVLAFPG